MAQFALVWDATERHTPPPQQVPHDIGELQKEVLGLGSYVLAARGRRLFSQGPVVARKKTKEEDGHLFLFSDLLLYW